MLTAQELRAVMPRLSQAKLNEYLPHLAQAMKEAGICTRLRKAAFLAQLAHESVQLRYMEEIASGQAYEGRKDLGNTEPGDGKRYKGRGPIQLTGRNNYRSAGRALGADLEGNPHLAAKPEWGFKIAAWFWTTRGLNELADKQNFRLITRRINGGLNGYDDRRRYYQVALEACQDDDDTPIADLIVELDGEPISEGRIDDWQGHAAAWVPLRKYEWPLDFTICLVEDLAVQIMTADGPKVLPLRKYQVNGQVVGHTPVKALREAFNLTSEWDAETRTVRLRRNS